MDSKIKTEINNESEKKKSKKWFRFHILNSTIAILRGIYSITDKHFKFGSRGQQAAPCSVVAIVFGRLFQPREWTSNFVDQVLEYGDKLYRISQTRNRIKPGTYMSTKLVYPEFFIGDYKCLVHVEESITFGNLFSESLNCPDLTEGLERFFKTNNSGVLTAQGNSVAIWRYFDRGFLYFDPAPCGEFGTRSPGGVACIIRFKYLNDLRELFLNNLNKKYDSRYCIDKVTIVKVQLIDRGTSDKYQINVDKNVLKMINPVEIDEKMIECTRTIPKEAKKAQDSFIKKETLSITISNYDIDTKFATEPLVDQNSFDTGYPYYDIEVNIPTTFTELPGDVAILHGWTHELSDVYKGKGAQNVANCIASFGMKKINPVKTWLRPKLDEILLLGDNLYAKIKAKNPTVQSLTAVDYNNSLIIINGKKLYNDVDLITIVGTLNSKIRPVLNLKQALEEFFLINKDGIIESSSMAVAVWTQDDYFYMFDPKECDANGVRVVETTTGTGGKKTKKDAGGLKKKNGGKCCVIRFSSIDALTAHILKNVNSAKKNDRFTIRHITVMDDIPGTRIWNEFQPGEAGRTWVLQGTISNDAEEFEDDSRGFQGIAMPITALIKATETPSNKWTSEIIDEVIREGNEYYNWCIPVEEEEEDRELTLRNLKKNLYIKNRRIKINLEESSVTGNLKMKTELPNLTEGLKKFFENHQYGIIEVKDLSVAVWKHQEIKSKDDKEDKDLGEEIGYYYFDPNIRGKYGEKNPEDDDGAACVIRALNIEELARRIELNTGEQEIEEDEESDEYVIHGFEIDSISELMSKEEIEIDKKIPIKPDLNNYSEISEDGACLVGSFAQDNNLRFKKRTCDKQQAANSLVTLAMSKFYNPYLWYREVIDDILKLGDKITSENLDNLPEDEVEGEQFKRDYLIPSEIDETFDIGVNTVTVEIEEGITSGTIEEIDGKIEEFFKTHQMGILRQDEIMLPIWKEGDAYFTLNCRQHENLANSAVYWFITISSLAAMIKQFLKPESNFTIDGINLENEYETRIAENERLKKTTSDENLWHHFPKHSDGVWRLVGNVSIDDDRFPEDNRNKQTAAIAVMSVIFSKVYEPRLWTMEVIDEVVITGDKLHSKSVERLGENINLEVNQIIPEFFLSNRRLDLIIKDCVEAGKLKNLSTSLDNFFKQYISGIVTIKGINFAIWMVKDVYYCVIPQNFNEDSDEKISVYRFKILQLLADHLINLFNIEEDYEVHAVDVIDWNKLEPWKFDPSIAVRPSNLPSLNAFKHLQGSARAILKGGIHQGSEIFPETIRNHQTAANCVVALAMALIKNPITWTKKTMDDILIIGYKVYRESIKFKSKTKLMPSDIIRVFYVGVNVLTADVETETVTGQVSFRPPTPDAKKAKVKKSKAPKAKGKKKGKIQKRERPPPPPPIFLEQGLKIFFENNKAGVLSAGGYMIALWKDQGVYFIYDPRARNDQGLDDEFGSSCTMWFACLEPLYDLILMNIEEKYGDYKICRAIIRTTIIEPLPIPVGFQPYLDCISNPISSTKKIITLGVETASEFNYIDTEISVLVGNNHMRDQSFDVSTRGFQSTAIAAIAIVVSLLHVPTTWTAELINSIIKYGNILHRDSIRLVRSRPRTLSPCELLDVFVVGDFRAIIQIHRHTTAGILFVHDLVQALTLFFKNNSAGILHTPMIAVAVMEHYGKFYMLDPRECDKFGRVGRGNGTACVIKCENIKRLALEFVNNYKSSCVYTVNAVKVLSLNFFSIH